MKCILKCIWSIALLVVGGCAVVTGTGSTGNSGGSGSGSSTTPITGGDSSGFTFSPTDFYVDVVAPANTTMYLHQNGNWTLPCKASVGDSNQDLICLLEVQEADLYDQGITFTYNTPKEQCSYQRFYPYYYYQFQTGDAPSSVSETITNGQISALSAAGGDSPTAICGASEVCLNASSAITCGWDYSGSSNPTGPNCCEGNYTLSVTTVTTGQPSNTVVTQQAWPGKKSNCLQGPATASAPKDLEGYPEALLTFVNDVTINSTYVVAAPISQSYRSTNVYASNYWTGPYTVTEANPIPASIPLAYWPNNPAYAGSGATNARPAQPWYEWVCLDEAGDIVDRIRILARSWSTHSAFAAQSTSGIAGPQGIPFNDHDVLDWATWLLIPDPSPPYNGANEGFGNTYPGYNN